MKISVLIPTLNEAGNVVCCVRNVQQQSCPCEIIVIDGGSTDGTVENVRPYAKVSFSERGRAQQMNLGARQAAGDVLLFLHADSRLPPDGLTVLERTMKDPQVVGGTFTLRFDSPKLLLRFFAFFTRFKFRYFHYGDQGIFVRRSVFERLGGFKEIPLMEDVDFLQRLRRVGHVTLINLPITTSARRFLQRGALRQQLLNTFLVVLFLLGANPRLLRAWYDRTNHRWRKPGCG